MVMLRAIWFGFCLLVIIVSFFASIFLACKGTYLFVKDYPDYFWSMIFMAAFIVFMYLFTKASNTKRRM
jgi:hypothetical protein